MPMKQLEYREIEEEKIKSFIDSSIFMLHWHYLLNIFDFIGIFIFIVSYLFVYFDFILM
jgi:hypothetical protein